MAFFSVISIPDEEGQYRPLNTKYPIRDGHPEKRADTQRHHYNPKVQEHYFEITIFVFCIFKAIGQTYKFEFIIFIEIDSIVNRVARQQVWV